MRPRSVPGDYAGAREAAAAVCRDLGLASRTLGLGHGAVFVAESGAGAPLVAVHGLQSCFFTWRALLQRPPAGWRVCVPDLPGFGASDDSAAGGTLDSLADALASVVDFYGGSPAVLCGHSYGALPCLALALRRPELVHALVLVGAPCPGQSRMGGIVSRNLMLFAYADLGALDQQVFEVYRAVGVRTPPAIQSEIVFPGPDRPLPVSLACLDIRGVADAIVPCHHHRAALAKLVPGMTAVDIATAGHCPHEEQPVQFRAHLGRFLNGLPGGRG